MSSLSFTHIISKQKLFKKHLTRIYFFLYIIPMKEIIWVMITIGFVVASTDVIEWLADKIQDKFK
jgi:hypothetical protein